jgi:S-adenosylmethionine/arginine decarboxylase-like enzyme
VANKPFGTHLTCDCYRCKQEAMDDINLAYSFLEEAVHALGVSKQSQPHVFRSPDAFVDKAGLSGWVPLIESSLTIHTLIPKRFVSIDFFTCSLITRKLKNKLLELIDRYFKPEKIESHLIKRGVEYNDES